jgi:hypothetical protein
VKLQSAAGQADAAGWPKSWLASTHWGVPLAHQPQPGSDEQSLQLMNPPQWSPQLPGQCANALAGQSLSAEPATP